FQRKNLTPDDSTEAEPTGQPEEQDERPDREVRPCHQHTEQEQQTGYRKKGIEHAHHDCVEETAQIAGDRTVCNTDSETDSRGQYSDGQREPGTVQNATQHITT